MHVALKQTLACSPDTAWELVRSPEAFQYASGPFLRFDPLDPEGFPHRWDTGRAYRARMLLLGVVQVGIAAIDVTESERAGARILTDRGGPVGGPMGVLQPWRHRIAISRALGGRALYRDRVDLVGPVALLAWPGLFLFWQWRGIRIRRLAAALPFV